VAGGGLLWFGPCEPSDFGNNPRSIWGLLTSDREGGPVLYRDGFAEDARAGCSLWESETQALAEKKSTPTKHATLNSRGTVARFPPVQGFSGFR